MGTIKKGILGGFSGKVGNVIGASFRGLDVMRSLPKKSGRTASADQLEQRERFGIMVGFLSPIKGMLEKAYGTAKGTKSKFNLALSYHIQKAITGTMPNLSIDYSQVVFTKGELLGPWAATVAATNAAQIDFAWQNNTGTGLSNADDKAVVLVYNPNQKLYVVLESDALRIDLALTLEIPATFTGDMVQCWMGFVSANGKDAATSVYLGCVTVL